MQNNSPVSAVDGFWLPESLRERVLTANNAYAGRSYADGRPCQPGDPGAVSARWPLLQAEQWQTLLSGLRKNRRLIPRGEAFWGRLQLALSAIGRRFANTADPLVVQAMATLPGYTGFSQAMIQFAFNALDMISLEQFSAAFLQPVTWRAAQDWQPMPGIPGRLRFYHQSVKGVAAQ